MVRAQEGVGELEDISGFHGSSWLCQIAVYTSCHAIDDARCKMQGCKVAKVDDMDDG